MWKKTVKPALIFVGLVYAAGLAIPVLAAAVDKVSGGLLSKAENTVAGLSGRIVGALPGAGASQITSANGPIGVIVPSTVQDG